uniref:Cytochrome P450 n=1 Tax=Phaedon brassicae TaxID=154011 RepID=A0A9Y1LRN4_9CUCU|nr:cytochrome P450 [Phaedon brassicae]
MLALALSFLSVLLLVLLCFAVAIVRNHNYLKAVPKPPGHWILGHLLEFGDPTDFLKKASNCVSNYGGLMRICLPPSWTVVVITDRDVTRKIFEETIDKSTDYDYFKPWLGTGLLTSKGNKWKQRRRLLSPCFGSLELMKGFISVFETLGVELIAKLQNEVGNTNLDLIPFMKRYTLDVLCETSMGVPLTSDGESYRESLENLCGVLVNRLKVPYKRIDSLFRLTEDYHIQKRSIKVIDSFFDEIFEKKLKILNEGRTNNGKRLAFLDLLMEFYKTGELTKEDIRAEVNTIMFGGHDTTAAGLAFTLYTLANNSHVQVILLANNYL